MFYHPSKVRHTILALVLVSLISLSFAPRSLQVVLGDSQTSGLPTVNHFLRPTVQAYGVNPLQGPPGTRITVSGFGFRGFANVESIVMGGIDILGNRTVSTDRDGAFQIDDLIVPGLSPGIVSMTVKVGTGDLETSGLSTFEVTEPTESPGMATPVGEALAPLADSVERVFHFENRTKTWSFFDPRPVFYSANDLTEIVEGQVYWIKVTRSVTATLNAKQRDLTCSKQGSPQQDCWNLVVW